MRSLFVTIALSVALAACAPTAPQGNRDTGIAAWDRSSRTLWVDGSQSYSVPPGTSTGGVTNGDTVTVTWQQQGGTRVATAVRVDRRRADEDRN